MASITLRILDGSDRGRTYDSLSTPVTIGREEGNSIQLNDDRVSRFHLKIQEDCEKLVLTDLESTNGTKVNGEDIQLRILRHGDMISLGRSVLWFGSKRDIADHLGSEVTYADAEPSVEGTIDDDVEKTGIDRSLEFDLEWGGDDDLGATLHAVQPPDLPSRMSPAQAAQLSEVFEYFHIRIRHLLETVDTNDDESVVKLDARRWQSLLEMQSRLAKYLRGVSEPE